LEGFASRLGAEALLLDENELETLFVKMKTAFEDSSNRAYYPR